MQNVARFDFDMYRAQISAVIAREGLRPLARRAGVEINQLRSIKEGRDPRPETWFELMEKLLGLQLYVGPVEPEAKAAEATFELDGVDFRMVPLYGAELSAGPGRMVEAEQVDGLVAFSRLWLGREGIGAQASLLRVRGDSMAPMLADGDLVLVDGARTKVERRRVYALVDLEGETRVKRLERVDGDTMALLSDNPAYPLELRRGPDLARLRILGEVRWSGHTWV